MMSRRIYWAALLCFSLLTGLQCVAQSPELNITFSDTAMTIGDALSIELRLSPSEAAMLEVDLSTLQQTDWELLEQKRLGDNAIRLSVTNFSDNAQLFPALNVGYSYNGQDGKVSSAPFPVQVNSLAADEDTAGLKPIKTVSRPANTRLPMWVWLAVLAGLGLILFGLFFRRHQKNTLTTPYLSGTPREQCLTQLSQLKSTTSNSQAETAPVALAHYAKQELGINMSNRSQLIQQLQAHNDSNWQALASIIRDWESLRYLPDVPRDRSMELLDRSIHWIKAM